MIVVNVIRSTTALYADVIIQQLHLTVLEILLVKVKLVTYIRITN